MCCIVLEVRAFVHLCLCAVCFVCSLACVICYYSQVIPSKFLIQIVDDPKVCAHFASVCVCCVVYVILCTIGVM